MKKNRLKSIESISKVISSNSVSAILFQDNQSAKENLENLRSNQNIENACIYDKENKIFATFNKSGKENFDFKNSLKSNLTSIATDNHIFYFYKIYDRKEFLGTFCVKTSLDNLKRQLNKKIYLTFLIVLLGIIISYLFALIFKNYITKPIIQLVETMAKVRKTKDLSLRAQNSSGDEIGKLGGEFNELISQIQLNEKELSKTNFQLEEKVLLRTNELEVKNKKLIEAKYQAEKSKKAKEQFLASMSHEIRTPLNAILGFQDLLKSTELNEEQQEFVNSIDFAGRNLLVIINDILDLSKIEAGKFLFESIEVDIAANISSVISLLDFRAKEKQITINLSISEELPKSFIGDGSRLSQILLNLIGNAIKFTDKGAIDVKLNLKVSQMGVKEIEYQIIDTGIGISQENLVHVFDRFTQASSETNRKYGGTGLGLTIVQQLVELQGGTITASSEEGIGSKFIFTLPLKEVSEHNLNQAKSEIIDSDTFLKGKHILLVEDMLLNQNLIKKIMKKWGVELSIANNGVEALDIVYSQRFDMILMDIQMPLMDGYEASRLIRAHEDLVISTIPIIALTAHASSSEAEKCLNLGMNAYLAKPFNAEQLKKEIVRVIQQANSLEKIEKVHDLSYLKEHAEGDMEFLKEMVDIFFNETPQLLEELNRNIIEKDFKKIKITSHSMKGIFLTFGIQQAGSLIKEIENLANLEINLEKIKNNFLLISELYLKAKEDIKVELEEF